MVFGSKFWHQSLVRSVIPFAIDDFRKIFIKINEMLQDILHKSRSNVEVAVTKEDQFQEYCTH
jgi:hypothetical protein